MFHILHYQLESLKDRQKKFIKNEAGIWLVWSKKQFWGDVSSEVTCTGGVRVRVRVKALTGLIN